MLSLFPIKNFPNEIFALVFSISFVFVILVELRILLRSKEQKSDNKSLIYILLGIVISLVVMVLLSFSENGLINRNFGYLGLLMIYFGFILRQYSIFILGKYFTPVVKKQSEQELLTTGLYKILRHPSYTGLILELLGAAISFSNWISILVVIIIFIPAIIYRIKTEEKFLIENFKDYKEYSKITFKLVPYVY